MILKYEKILIQKDNDINKRNAVMKVLKTYLLLLISIFVYSCNKEVSVTPPDAPPPNGYFFVDSYPTGAHIYLNGKARRRATPDSLTWLETNTYNITLKKDLFRDTSFTIDVEESKRKSIFIDYSKNPAMLGSLFCDSKPEKAVIILNDSVTTLHTPYTIKNLIPGYYKIRYKLADHRDDSTVIAVSSGNLSSTKLSLVDTTIWKDYNTSNSAIKTNNLKCIVIDQDNVIWIGTDGDGILRFDGSNWSVINSVNSKLLGNVINGIVADENNDKWIGTQYGPCEIVAGESQNVVPYGWMVAGSIPTITSVATDYHGTVALGTINGLFLTYMKSGTRKWDSAKSSLPDNYITAVTIDKNNYIWAGTRSGGIAIYEGDTWQIYNFSNSNIFSDNVTAAATSPNGSVWFGFKPGVALGSGLSYFDGSIWNKSYVVPIGATTTKIFFDSKNGLWLGTDKGLVKSIDYSTSTLYNKDEVGLDLTNITGIAEDLNGNLWITTKSNGLIEYKK